MDRKNESKYVVRSNLSNSSYNCSYHAAICSLRLASLMDTVSLTSIFIVWASLLPDIQLSACRTPKSQLVHLFQGHEEQISLPSLNTSEGPPVRNHCLNTLKVKVIISRYSFESLIILQTKDDRSCTYRVLVKLLSCRRK